MAVRVRVLALLVLALAVSAPPLRSQITQTDMRFAREGHTATTLAGGDVVVIGGRRDGGYVGTAEVWRRETRTFAESGALETPRAEHSATALRDGRVLVAGGDSAIGPLQSTEIFDGRAFTAGPWMNRKRAGHSATELADGRVLIIGGDDEGTVEVFDPRANSFTLLATRLQAARSRHSAVLLGGTSILVAGGLVAGRPSETAEILDIGGGRSFPPMRMRAARVQPALLRLNEHQVQMVGGDGEHSMEMFNVDRRYFTARAHLYRDAAAGSALLRSCVRDAALGAERHRRELEARGITRVALLDRNDYAAASSGAWTLITGGRNDAGATLATAVLTPSSTASISTDKTDYPPNETVTIRGTGWLPGEGVSIVIRANRDDVADVNIEAVADADGTFVDRSFTTTEKSVGVVYAVAATGRQSQMTAFTTFSDAWDTYINLSVSPNPSIDGEPVTLIANVNGGYSPGLSCGVTDGYVTFYRHDPTNLWTPWVSLGPVADTNCAYTLTAPLPTRTDFVAAVFTPYGHVAYYCCNLCCFFGFCDPCVTIYYDYNGSRATVEQTVLPRCDLAAPPAVTAATAPDATSCSAVVSDAQLGVATASAGCGPVTRLPAGNEFPVGTTVVTYQAVDGVGTTFSATQTVTVVDATPPTVALIGDAVIECGSNFVDPGVTMHDNCSTNLIMIQSIPLNGVFTIQYLVTDGAGNSASAVRTVKTADTTGPAIALNGDADMTVECHSAFVDPGASANDLCAGPTPVTASGTVDANTLGTYVLTYSSTDPSGNASSVTRTVHVVDTTPPAITLNGDADMTVECHTAFVDPGASANDACAGPTPLTVSGTVDANTPGTCVMTYSSTDPSGNAASAARTVHVVDTTPPVMTLIGPATITVECGAKYVDPGATAIDSCAGDLSSQVAIRSGQRVGEPVNYDVLLEVGDPAGNIAAITRHVIVVDTTPPTITTCPAPRSVAGCSGSVPDFTAEAAAADSCSGRIKVLPVSQSPAPGTIVGPGAHDVTITFTDLSRNAASCTTTFTVANQAPSVSANGPYAVVEGSSITVSATGSDADGDAIAYAWDLDGDGTFESSGSSAVFAATDGPASPAIRVQATDACGQSTIAATTIVVANAAPQVSAISGAPAAPIPVNTTVSVSAPFSDAGTLDTHTVTWTWDDGSSTAGVVAESNGSGVASASHVFTAAGVYRITATVTDKDGASGSAVYEFVNVYDVAAGTVTGNGSIDSPAGAYSLLPTKTGSGSFAFNVRYSNGTPQGTAQFRLQGTTLIFRATSIQALIISGTRAQIRGEGTIAGQSATYGFLLTAATDAFRIKIWDAATGAVLYDNVRGASDDLDAASPQPIASGSITIRP